MKKLIFGLASSLAILSSGISTSVIAADFSDERIEWIVPSKAISSAPSNRGNQKRTRWWFYQWR